MLWPQADKLMSFWFHEMRWAVSNNSSEENISNIKFLQSRLLTWMSDSDRRQLNLNNQEEVVQKYVLHLFSHEMELYGWYNNTGCLTGSHEYVWFGTYY